MSQQSILLHYFTTAKFLYEFSTDFLHSAYRGMIKYATYMVLLCWAQNLSPILYKAVLGLSALYYLSCLGVQCHIYYYLY